MQIRLTIGLVCFCFVACDDTNNNNSPGDGERVNPAVEYALVPSESDARVEPPTGELVYQPKLYWGGRDATHQGTGFLAKTPGGEVVGITSAHFVDFKSGPLNKVDWLSVNEGSVRVSFDKLLGPVGHAIQFDERTGAEDASDDFLIFAGTGSPPEIKSLELDTRKRLEQLEPVWLPNKARAGEGYELLEGYVLMADRGRILTVFRPAFKLQSQSGTPVISQRTGRVIGILTAGASDRTGKTEIVLTPAWFISERLESKQRRSLKEIKGDS